MSGCAEGEEGQPQVHNTEPEGRPHGVCSLIRHPILSTIQGSQRGRELGVEGSQAASAWRGRVVQIVDRTERARVMCGTHVHALAVAHCAARLQGGAISVPTTDYRLYCLSAERDFGFVSQTLILLNLKVMPTEMANVITVMPCLPTIQHSTIYKIHN